MKFVMVNNIDAVNHNNADKVIIGNVKLSYVTTNLISLAYLCEVKKDFEPKNEFSFVHSNSSIQIRPKAIYRCDKGYYKKVDGKKVFFDEGETIEIENAIIKFKNYLKSNFNIVNED